MRNNALTFSEHKLRKSQLLTVEPILTCADCKELREIKSKRGYSVEFRIVGNDIFVSYNPELDRKDMELNGFVLSRISRIYDELQILMSV
jgi:hypothetical protein